MEGQRWKAPPAHKDRGRRETPCQRGQRTSSGSRISETTVEVQDPTSPYVYTGDHPDGYELYDHPLRGLCRWLEGRFVGLTTDELDALEDYEETLDESLLGQPDPRECPLRGVSRGVRLGMERW